MQERLKDKFENGSEMNFFFSGENQSSMKKVRRYKAERHVTPDRRGRKGDGCGETWRGREREREMERNRGGEHTVK